MSAFVLKLIALVTMIIDHTGATFGNIMPLRIIGRVAFPLYVFLIAEGLTKTRNIKKYMLRLLAFAFISEIPFDLMLNNSYPYEKLSFFSFSHQNIFFTLFLGTLAVYWYEFMHERIKNIGGRLLTSGGLLSIFTVTLFLNTDYSILGVAFIYALYMGKKYGKSIFAGKLGQAIIMTAFVALLYFSNIPMLVAALVAVLLAVLYNGKRGPSLKWFFYAAYPAHLLILFLIAYFFWQPIA